MLILRVWLIITAYFLNVNEASHRIFHTIISSRNNERFHCISTLLNFYQRSHSANSIYLGHSSYGDSPIYCRQLSKSEFYSSFPRDKLRRNDYPVFPFTDLRSKGVTYQQLYDWNAPIDLIEDYIEEEQTGFFVNCSNSLWFGLECEYTLDSNDSLKNIITDRFLAKDFLPNDLSFYTNGTCYEMIDDECDSIICLDWREICDGKSDCKTGYDERYCHQLEMNECDPETEQRCKDGQCLDRQNGRTTLTDICSEASYVYLNFYYYCYRDFSNNCQNKKCPPLFFSCGDGDCYDGPSLSGESCYTQRDKRYLEQMPSSSTLILFSHLILTYNNTQPKYICYNQTLCPYLSSKSYAITTQVNNLACRPFETFSNQTYDRFDVMIKDVKRLVRSCSLITSQDDNFHKNCSVFRCDDHSKCLSFHRLSDGVADCANDEDERQINVCSYNLSQRFICDNETKCISHHLFGNKKENCIDGSDEHEIKSRISKCDNPFSTECSRKQSFLKGRAVHFMQICNGAVEFESDMNNNTDETDCLISTWPCETFFTKCNRVWNCPDGHDELGCNAPTRSSLYCNNDKHFCLNISTGQPICLPTSRVNDNIVDCVGYLDEHKFCRDHHPNDIFRRYRCHNSPSCISIHRICDCQQDCAENDDETTACEWFYNGKKCNDWTLPSRNCFMNEEGTYDGRSDLFCDLTVIKNDDLWIENQKRKSSQQTIEHRVKRQSIEKYNYSVIWSCNHGLYVRSNKDPGGYACFCTIYYYGDRCQYQRKRVYTILTVYRLTAFNYHRSIFTFVILLERTTPFNVTIVSHHKFVHRSLFACIQEYSFDLLYPIEEFHHSLGNHSVHIHMIDSRTLQYYKSWKFPLSFEFLPVQLLSKNLYIPELTMKDETKRSLTSITNNSLCIGHDISVGRDICICALNYLGSRCLVPFQPCSNNNCNGHGKCEFVSVDYNLYDSFICTCDVGWFGISCNQSYPRINISFSENVEYLSSNIAFLHVTDFFDSPLPRPFEIYSQRVQGDTPNLSFILDQYINTPLVVFIQFYEHQDKFDYYLLYYHSMYQTFETDDTLEVRSSHRCLPISEIFNKTILAQKPLRRVKNYQQPCLNDQLVCFYDNHVMCVCANDHYTHCFSSFNTHLPECEKKWCHDRGRCVQNDNECPIYSRCICEECAYGTYCEFSSDGYSLSLDGILGSHISLTATHLSQQPHVIQVAVSLFSIVVVLGFIFNILSIMTLIQKETHEVGCGLYLLTSSIIGLLTMITLICKLILLLTSDRSDVSCSIVEFALKWCPISCEWLNACVAFERTIAVKRQVQYSRITSKYVSKWITPFVILLVGLICMPELFFRRIMVNEVDGRTWCVLTLNKQRPGVLIVYSILNVLSFIIPLVVNFCSGIIIIISTLELKLKTKKRDEETRSQRISPKARIQLIQEQIHVHKHILISPLVLGLLSLPRVILTFIFVCTKLDGNSIPSLLAYLVAFFPSMAILFAFVWPSQVYRTAFLKSTKAIIPKRLRNAMNFTHDLYN